MKRLCSCFRTGQQPSVQDTEDGKDDDTDADGWVEIGNNAQDKLAFHLQLVDYWSWAFDVQEAMEY